MPNSNDKNRKTTRRQQPARRQQQPARQQEPQGPDAWDILKADLDRNLNVYGKLLSRGTRAASEPQVQRFSMQCYQAVWNKPDLLQANRDSLLLAFAEAAVVGLSLNPTAKEAFLEIRSGLVRFGTQYQGLVKLMHRGTNIDFIFADVVRLEDHFKQYGGSEPRIEHVSVKLGFEPDNYDEDEAVLAAYAVVKTKGASLAVHEVARRRDILKAMSMSKGKGGNPPSSAWRDWFPRMAKKLPLRRLANIIPGADEARMVLGVEDAQSRGEAVTFDRVSQVFDPIAAPRPANVTPSDGDALRKLMESSGPASGPASDGEQGRDGEQGGDQEPTSAP